MAARYDMTLWRGSYFDRTFRILHSDNSLHDFTGHTFLATIRKDEKSTTPLFTFQWQLESDSGQPNRVIRYWVNANSTELPVAGKYHFRIEIQPPAGAPYMKRWVEGTVTIKD